MTSIQSRPFIAENCFDFPLSEKSLDFEKQKWLMLANELPVKHREAYKKEIETVFCASSNAAARIPSLLAGSSRLSSESVTSLETMRIASQSLFNKYKEFQVDKTITTSRLGALNDRIAATTLQFEAFKPPVSKPLKSKDPMFAYRQQKIYENMAFASMTSAGLQLVSQAITVPLEYAVGMTCRGTVKVCELNDTTKNGCQAIGKAFETAVHSSFAHRAKELIQSSVLYRTSAKVLNQLKNPKADSYSELLLRDYGIPRELSRTHAKNSSDIIVEGLTFGLLPLLSKPLKAVRKVLQKPSSQTAANAAKPLAARQLRSKKPQAREFSVEDRLRWKREFQDFTIPSGSHKESWLEATFGKNFSSPPKVNFLSRHNSSDVVLLSSNSGRFIVRDVPILQAEELLVESLALPYLQGLNLNLKTPCFVNLGNYGDRYFIVRTYLDGLPLDQMAKHVGQYKLYSRERADAFSNYLNASKQLGLAVGQFQAQGLTCHVKGGKQLVEQAIEESVTSFRETAKLLQEVSTLRINEKRIQQLTRSFRESSGNLSHSLGDHHLSNLIWDVSESRIGFVGARNVTPTLQIAQRDFQRVSSSFLSEGIPAGLTTKEAFQLKTAFETSYGEIYPYYNEHSKNFFESMYYAQSVRSVAEHVARGKLDHSNLDGLVTRVNTLFK